ncbi:MAG: hypothetical protein DHS20C16_29980 [Phycisphaerae bacterium]|nr:MAG: hypothetical protein DHS20C16_29980 [Phycisphaerae bacterium]
MIRSLTTLWRHELDVMHLANQMNRIEIDVEDGKGSMTHKNVKRLLCTLMAEALINRADTIYAFHDEDNALFRTLCNKELRFLQGCDEWYEFPAAPGYAYELVLGGLERLTITKTLNEAQHQFRFQFREESRVATWAQLALPDGFVIYLDDERPSLPKDPILYPELLPNYLPEY